MDKKSALQNNSLGLINLSILYENGIGAEKDSLKADSIRNVVLPQLLKVAEKGQPRAQSNLGYMYDNGEGVVQNNREAVKWYTKAAEQGYATAQCILGTIYGENQEYGKSLTYLLLAKLYVDDVTDVYNKSEIIKNLQFGIPTVKQKMDEASMQKAVNKYIYYKVVVRFRNKTSYSMVASCLLR